MPRWDAIRLPYQDRPVLSSTRTKERYTANRKILGESMSTYSEPSYATSKEEKTVFPWYRTNIDKKIVLEV